jgi:NosR/NirI family transcriptional regulator, nitrous oxide reductase regulator
VFGVRTYEDMRSRVPDGAHIVFMASNGPHDFHGTSHFWKADGYRFNRVRIVQDGRTIGFVHEDYQPLLVGAAEGIQSQNAAGMFTVPASAGFDPVKPWTLELVVNAAGQLPAAVIPIEYRLPPALILMPQAPAVAARVLSSRISAGRTQMSGLALALASQPKYSQWPQYWHCPIGRPSELV